MDFLNFINGDWSPAFDGKVTLKVSPVSGEVVGQSSSSGLMDVVRAVQAANKALPAWMKSSREERATLLESLAEKIESQAAIFSTAIANDLGTPVAQTLEFSIPQSVGLLRAQSSQLREPERSGQNRLPVGLVAVITPATDPLVCLISRLAPAWAGANSVIVKPSSQTPQTATRLARSVKEVGFPDGTLAVLFGAGSDVGEILLQHPGVSTVSFQGSTQVGRRINGLAAESLKKIHLSLGAKNPVLLFADTQLETAIPEIVKICVGLYPSRSLQGSRLFIQDGIFKSALEILKTEFDRIKIGDPHRPETQVGPLPSHRAAQAFGEAVVLARKENGKVLTAGEAIQLPAGGSFVKPVLFADLTNCSTLQQDEILGPLVLASSFKYQHDALKHANVSPYGRIGYVFESDPEKAKRVAAKLETGTVNLNSSKLFLNLERSTPLLKSSGNGFEGLKALSDFFVRITSASAQI